MALVREFREFGVLCEFGRDPCDRVEEKEEGNGKGREEEQQVEVYLGGGGDGCEDHHPFWRGGEAGMGGGAFAGGAGVGGDAFAGGEGGFGSVFTPGAGANLSATTSAGSYFQSRAQSDSVRALWGDAREGA